VVTEHGVYQILRSRQSGERRPLTLTVQSLSPGRACREVIEVKAICLEAGWRVSTAETCDRGKPACAIGVQCAVKLESVVAYEGSFNNVTKMAGHIFR